MNLLPWTVKARDPKVVGCLGSWLPVIAPMRGVIRSLISAWTMALNATPTTTATARSMRLPRNRNFRKPLMLTPGGGLHREMSAGRETTNAMRLGAPAAGWPPSALVIGRQHAEARGVSLAVTVRGIVIPAEELTWRFSRSQGPGGQSVNTTDSRAELSFDISRSAVLPPVL